MFEEERLLQQGCRWCRSGRPSGPAKSRKPDPARKRRRTETSRRRFSRLAMRARRGGSHLQALYCKWTNYQIRIFQSDRSRLHQRRFYLCTFSAFFVIYKICTFRSQKIAKIFRVQDSNCFQKLLRNSCQICICILTVLQLLRIAVAQLP